LRPAASATPDRILIATAAGLIALLAVVQTVPPILSELGQASNWLWLVYTIVLLGIPFALLIPAVIRPRSVTAAVAAALTVGVLLILGTSAQAISWPRLVMYLAAILCLAGLVLRLIRGIVDHDLRVLWIVPGLFLGFAIGYLAAGLTGLPIWNIV
jgi:hypothetical protein